MPFYRGIDINIFTRMRTARAREASNRCNMVDSGLTQKTGSCGACIFVCVVRYAHKRDRGGVPLPGVCTGMGCSSSYFLFFFDFSVMLVLCLSMLFAISIAQPRFYGFFMPYFRFKSFLWWFVRHCMRKCLIWPFLYYCSTSLSLNCSGIGIP